jgi:hypothetical protein
MGVHFISIKGAAKGRARGLSERKEQTMSIAWKKDVDNALAEAQSNNRSVLLDFNATPM